MTRVELSHHFSQRDSSRARVTKNCDSSRVIDSSHAMTANDIHPSNSFPGVTLWLVIAPGMIFSFKNAKIFICLACLTFACSDWSDVSRWHSISSPSTFPQVRAQGEAALVTFHKMKVWYNSYKSKVYRTHQQFCVMRYGSMHNYCPILFGFWIPTNWYFVQV